MQSIVPVKEEHRKLSSLVALVSFSLIVSLLIRETV